MFVSPTYGEIDFNDIPKKMLCFYEINMHYNAPFSIVVGTDSQNFSYTKMVSVISIVCHGHGGIFFYEISKIDKIKDVRTKLYAETQRSLEVATQLIDAMESNDECHDMYISCPISIHVDAGNAPNGKTGELIPEIVGWVTSLGYGCDVKPDSYAASSIADKISK